MTAPTPPGVWIVRRDSDGVLTLTPAEFVYAQECEEAYQERLRLTHDRIWGVLGRGIAKWRTEQEGGNESPG